MTTRTVINSKHEYTLMMTMTKMTTTMITTMTMTTSTKKKTMMMSMTTVMMNYSYDFCLYGPLNCILFHKFFRQLSVFSLCSSVLISAFQLYTYLFKKDSFSPDLTPDWAQNTN